MSKSIQQLPLYKDCPCTVGLALMNESGIIALSLHEGTFRGISDHKHTARYFHEWQGDEIKKFLEQFYVKNLETFTGESASKRKTWINLILQKT